MTSKIYMLLKDQNGKEIVQDKATEVPGYEKYIEVQSMNFSAAKPSISRGETGKLESMAEVTPVDVSIVGYADYGPQLALMVCKGDMFKSVEIVVGQQDGNKFYKTDEYKFPKGAYLDGYVITDSGDNMQTSLRFFPVHMEYQEYSVATDPKDPTKKKNAAGASFNYDLITGKYAE